MQVEITQKHIDEGIKLSGFNCAMALALKDAGISHRGVSPWDIYFPDGYRVCLSDEMSGFVRQFDLGIVPVEPCTFEFPYSEQLEQVEAGAEAVLVKA